MKIKIKNILKRSGAVSLALLMLVLGINSNRVHAYWVYYSKYTKGNYTYYVYNDSVSYYSIYYGNTKVSTGFDYKRNKKKGSGFTISQTATMSLGSQTKKSLNGDVDFSGYGVPAKVGGSIEATQSVSWATSSTVSRTVTDSDPVGYYSYNVLLNKKRINIVKSKTSTGATKGNITFYAPSSEAYRAIVFSNVGLYDAATKDY